MEMKTWRHIFQGLSGIMMMSSIACSAFGSDNRLVVVNDRFWRLSEIDWSLCDVTREFGVVTGASGVLVVDYCTHSQSGEFGDLGVGVSRNGRHEIMVIDLAHAKVVRQIMGDRPGFRLKEGRVGYFKINPNTVEDAFYISSVAEGAERMAISGGFDEPYPVVASESFFYVFRSASNRTFRVGARINAVDEPQFLNRRAVLAVWGNDERFLVEDRATKEKAVIDGAGKVVCILKIERPFAALEFSSNGTSVYVSMVRIENNTEVVDFASYEIESGNLKVIKRAFAVGPGKMSKG